MTRKHFIAIAEILRDARDAAVGENMTADEAITYVGEALASYFYTQNDSFDRERFLRAADCDQAAQARR